MLPMPSEQVPWPSEFERELLDFPGSVHDDQMDAFSMLVLYLEEHLSTWLQTRDDVVAGRRAPGIPPHLQYRVRRYGSW